MKKIKLYIQYAISVLFSAFMIWAGYVIYKGNVNLDLNKTARITAPIEHVFIGIHQSNGRYASTARVFAFNLKGLKQTLGVYRHSKDYSDLLNKIKDGDTITVYFKLLTDNPIDLDVYQIEKDREVILDYKEYSKKYTKTSFFIIFLGVICFPICIYQIRKQNKSK